MIVSFYSKTNAADVSCVWKFIFVPYIVILKSAVFFIVIFGILGLIQKENPF
jgi:hypothetical protein